MTCQEFKSQINAFLDSELASDLMSAMNSHMNECADCKDLVQERKQALANMRASAPYFEAPSSLRFSTEDKLFPPNKKPFWKSMFLPGFAAGAVSVLLVTTLVMLNYSPPTPANTELFNEHIRSLMGTHLLDVISTDQHTVKPWFLGKLTFSPDVPNLKDEGFPLIGGRLDFINKQRAAALIYRANKHIINVFVTNSTLTNVPAGFNGYHALGWQIQGLNYWAISDIPVSKLAQFESQFKLHASED